METLEHTFPLPEVEVHKLDELTGQLPSGASWAKEYVSNNAWMMVGISALVGCLLGYFWPRKAED